MRVVHPNKSLFMRAVLATISIMCFYSVVPAQQFKTTPLYSFLSSKGYRLYKLGSTLPAGLSDGPWKNEGVVAYVLADPAAGSHPVYGYLKSDQWGTRYSYNRKDNESGGGWNLQGVVFHVPPQGTPNTTRLFKLYLPARETNPGKTFTGMVPGTDAVFLTADVSQREALIAAGWQGAGLIGYVWTSPPVPPAQPDLVVKQTSVDGNQIRALIMNQGKQSVSSVPGVIAGVFVYDKAGKVVFTKAQNLGGMSAGQSRPVTFDTGNFDLKRKSYKIFVDQDNHIAESDNNNNETAILDVPMPKLKVQPLPPDHVVPPHFTVTAIQSSPSASQPKRTVYRLGVTNWNEFNPEWFMSMENIMPPTPCGGGQTQARLLVHFMVIKNGVPIPFGCKPLLNQQDLKVLDFALPGPLGDADKVKISLVDTVPGGRSYDSFPYPVGVFGIAKILTATSCKMLLGRESSYVCTTDPAFNLCEGLRQKGKPIECRRVGK